MTLDVTKPTDQELVSMLPYYIRQHAVEINRIAAITPTNLELSDGTTYLVEGVDLVNTLLEVVFIRSAGTSTISQITNGVNGHIKTFVFQDNNITFVDGDKTSGHLYLNQLPAGSSFVAQQGDVITLINVGGDGGSEYGYWKELWRGDSVK